MEHKKVAKLDDGREGRERVTIGGAAANEREMEKNEECIKLEGLMRKRFGDMS